MTTTGAGAGRARPAVAQERSRESARARRERARDQQNIASHARLSLSLARASLSLDALQSDRADDLECKLDRVNEFVEARLEEHEGIAHDVAENAAIAVAERHVQLALLG